MNLHHPFDSTRLTRRRLAQLAAAAAASPLLLAFDHDVTHPVSQGPAYKPGAPFRTEIINPGTPGSRFLLRGRVFSTSDKPLPEALVDLWNVQNSGEYDFAGFNLRGRQLTTKEGRFEFLTIEAIPYGSRTAHFHFKVSAPGYQPLTTELYLPGIAQNSRDSSFRNSNLLQTVDEAGIRKGTYEFYLQPA
jgi:protocatechuate 3,4-dioxygenase beta subunit